MIIARIGNRRLLLPRWRSVADTVAAGELGSSRPASNIDVKVHERIRAVGKETLAAQLSIWRNDKNVDSALDLVGTSVASGLIPDEAEDAAQMLLDGKIESAQARALSLYVLGKSEDKREQFVFTRAKIQTEIANKKRLLRLMPRDALLAAEAARLYTISGQNKQALELMRRALIIAPVNKYIFRSAIRLLIHAGKADEAAAIASRTSGVERDPWLLSAALVAGDAAARPSVSHRKVRELLNDKAFSRHDISELAGTLATHNLLAGDFRLARSRFRQSLEQPTENAIAQAEWAQTKDANLIFDVGNLASKGAFEALALESEKSADWSTSVSAAERWMDLEPFNPSPFLHASAISATVFDDAQSALRYTEEGLRSNPDDPTLWNNKAFAEINLGLTEAAIDSLAKAKKLAGSRIAATISATQGLIHFRQGRFHSGVRCYSEALDEARRTKRADIWVRAAAHFAAEIAIYDPHTSIRLIENVRKVVGELKARGIQMPTIINPLMERINGVAIERARQVERLIHDWGRIDQLPLDFR